VGIDFENLDKILLKDQIEKNHDVRILWNHRWEFDKNPNLFLKLLRTLKKSNINFELILLGQKFNSYPEEFEIIEKEFKSHIIHIGHISDYSNYLNLVLNCNILPVTSNHDFFGISVLEAIYLGLTPILPYGLVYEEHFKSIPSSLFYKDENELFEKTKEVILKQNQRKFEFGKFIKSKYNIRRIIQQYDGLFSTFQDATY